MKRKTHCRFVITLLIVWIGSMQYTDAQLVTNQTNFYIPEDLEVHINGDAINEGFIQNQGSILLKGDWRNTSIYQGLGSITLEGSAQRFSNNTNEVYSLIINGDGIKRIEDKILITNRLDLTLGIVSVTSSDELRVAGGGSITGGSSRSYVDGALLHEGTGYKFFPIGKNGGYYPVEMLNIAGIGVVTSMEVFDNVPALSFQGSNSLFSKVYWQRSTISGTFLNSPVSLGHQIPADYTNRHALDIFEAEDESATFAPLGNITVEHDSDIDKVTSASDATGQILVIGEGTPADGLPGLFYLPTSLSPTAADPDNRVIKVFGNELVESNFQFIVYNRWGLKVYESHSLEDMIATGWDGHIRSGSGDLPSGAYPYFFRATKKSGETIEQKGVISILR